MPLSEAQRTIAEDPRRFRVAVCGRRFGKTYLSVRELARAARIPNRRCWYVAPTYRQAKQTVWEQLKSRLIALRWVQKINESDLTIYLINNSTISLRSGDNPDSLRGVGLDWLCLDEFADLDPTVWYEVLRPTLSDRQGRALFIGTPKGTSNWAKDIFDMARTNDQWASYSFTTLQGGRVTEEEIQSARSELDERTFRQEYEASFENFTGKIFYAFSEQNIESYSGSAKELHIGMDFNVSPMTATVGVRDGDRLFIIDEIVIHNSNTDEMVAEINSRYSGYRIHVYPDPAARQRKTSAAGRTDLTILQNAGFTVHCPSAHRPVKDDINAVNARLCSGSEQARRLLVDARCKYTIQSLERWCYKPGTSIPDKDSGLDHIMDALRYCVGYIWPIQRDITPQPPQRWGHKIGTLR